jgi:hypothetical protein
MQADAIETIAIRTRMAKDAETEVFEKIGEATDPLALETVEFLDRLPSEERQEFVRGVFRRLVVQSLYTAKSLDADHAQSLRYSTLHRYATGSVIIDLGGDLSSAVVEESFPKYEQPELEIL